MAAAAAHDGVAVAAAGLAGRAPDGAADADGGDDVAARRRRPARSTDATPGSRSSTLSAHGRPSAPASTLPAEPRSSGSSGADRHDRAQLVGRVERRDAARRRVAVDDVELHRLAGRRPAAARGPAGRPRRAGRPAPPPGRAPTSRQPRAKRPSSSRRTRPCASRATARRWAVARGRPVAATQLGRATSGRPSSGVEDGDRLVEHADVAYPGVHHSELYLRM